MSCERRVTTFTQVEEVRIECCNKKEIEALEKTIISSLEQKLEKLNILIRNCSIYSDGKSILVNDRFNICSGLSEVAVAFGLTIVPVSCSLKGKNYLITDGLLDCLAQFDCAYSFGKTIQNQEISKEIQEVLKQGRTNHPVDREILSMVKNIKTNGQYVTTKSRTITEETEDGRLVGRSKGEWVSDAEEIRKKLLQLSRNAQETVRKTNEQLRDGTSKLIYSRARQMGYAVQEIKKGTQVQLVLVRCE